MLYVVVCLAEVLFRKPEIVDNKRQSEHIGRECGGEGVTVCRVPFSLSLSRGLDTYDILDLSWIETWTLRPHSQKN